MKKITLLFAVSMFVTGSLAVAGCGNSHNPDKEKNSNTEETMRYRCPMDCENGTIYASPGQCSVCGMDLEEAPAKS